MSGLHRHDRFNFDDHFNRVQKSQQTVMRFAGVMMVGVALFWCAVVGIAGFVSYTLYLWATK